MKRGKNHLERRRRGALLSDSVSLGGLRPSSFVLPTTLPYSSAGLLSAETAVCSRALPDVLRSSGALLSLGLPVCTRYLDFRLRRQFSNNLCQHLRAGDDAAAGIVNSLLGILRLAGEEERETTSLPYIFVWTVGFRVNRKRLRFDDAQGKIAHDLTDRRATNVMSATEDAAGRTMIVSSLYCSA